ncbi:hypothetical protein [uncultured Roseovarius sp.]|uniref:hypothetical protein n=1 Tax=uncultured Roseovarius sp. TaxID=293344 RepID=UPI002624A6E0|nr:hypothetical protein [uncultured Roseovarius sp.]
MRNLVLALFAASALTGCAGQKVWAPDDAVARATYRHEGPTRLTLFTMINNRTGAGAHTSLMINGSQRVIFDPAGSFKHESLPERNDVVFGITPPVADVYTRYHARKTYHVKVQELDVSPAVAEAAINAVMSYGAVPSAMCARSTSSVLAGLPGFENIQTTWYPVKLAEQFAKVPGVREQELYEYDSDDNSKVLREWAPDAVARAKTLQY